MSAGLLIITHNDIGEQLLNTATTMLDTCPLPAAAIAINTDCNPDNTIKQALQLVDELDSGEGVLVLTDMYGSTPSNIANQLSDGHHVVVVTGINLPMLIRVLNYPRLNLEQLADKAGSGGHDGIIICETKC